MHHRIIANLVSCFLFLLVGSTSTSTGRDGDNSNEGFASRRDSGYERPEPQLLPQQQDCTGGSTVESAGTQINTRFQIEAGGCLGDWLEKGPPNSNYEERARVGSGSSE